ncbi:MAG: VCBS repeat-containing protein, partial [Myxococcales bacterium]|nr:VCBS repeat-containing protein [Myxococcales bacterium]
GPFVVDAGNVPAGLGLNQHNATLIDLNGDALPDFLDTSSTADGGAHRIYFAELMDGGASRYPNQPVLSARASRSEFLLSEPNVQVMDVNGDGFADLVNTLGGGRVLCNHGDGDWSTEGCGVSAASLATLSSAFQSAEGADARGTRMLDIDNDRRIDVIRTISPGNTQIFRNTGAGFEALSPSVIDHL